MVARGPADSEQVAYLTGKTARVSELLEVLDELPEMVNKAACWLRRAGPACRLVVAPYGFQMVFAKFLQGSGYDGPAWPAVLSLVGRRARRP